MRHSFCLLWQLWLAASQSCEPSSLLQMKVSHFRGTPNETKQQLASLLTGLKTQLEPFYPYNVMTCKGEQALTTKSMTWAEYYAVRDKIQDRFPKAYTVSYTHAIMITHLCK